MKLYLNGWEVDLVESVLKDAMNTRPSDTEKIGKLLERMGNCKNFQKPHNKGNKPT
jgi:hypothetical protein